jgi:hypothetical protein
MQKSDAGSIISSTNRLHWTSETAIEQRIHSCQANARIGIIEQCNSDLDASRAMLTSERCDIDECWRPACWIA